MKKPIIIKLTREKTDKYLAKEKFVDNFIEKLKNSKIMKDIEKDLGKKKEKK